MLRTKQSSRGHIAALIAAMLSVCIAFILFTHKQYILDQISVWQYTPSGEIEKLTERSDMSSGGVFYFYASHPSIDSADVFNKQCTRKEESIAVLGCFDGRTISIYNITNDRLDGIKEVTAAHEMLHAAYGRLDDDTKKKLNILLETEYAKLKDTPEFSERMAFYARAEPGERDNELHSIIGTEIQSISPELEAHYKAYFKSRSKVIELHASYAAVFSDLQARSKQLAASLTALGTEIEADSLRYNDMVTSLNRDINSFNDRANNNEFTSNAEFQAGRSLLVARASGLEGARQAINSKVTQYDTLRQELTTVASESEALNKSIDSSLAPAPTL